MLVFAGIAGGIALALWTRKLIALDPFAAMARPDPGLGLGIGIRLDDVDFRHYHDKELTLKARIARLDVLRDRQSFDFFDVRDGWCNTRYGPFQFETQRASWNAASQQVRGLSAARVFDKNMDLVVPSFAVDQRLGLLSAPGRITGRLYDGQLVAYNLRYTLKDGSYEVGPAEWEGMLALTQDDGKEAKRTRWKIKSDGVVTHKDDLERWPNGEATDGDVLVKAQLIERKVSTDVVTATGKVVYFSQKTNLSCDKAVIYRKEKRSVFTGTVNMLLKPESEQDKPLKIEEIPPFRPLVPDEVAKGRPPAPPVADKKMDDELRSGKVRKYPVVALAEKIEYWYEKGKRHAIITGNPQARQELPGGRWRHAWSPKGLYDGEKETLRLVSAEGKKDTRVRSSLGDDLVCAWFELSTKDGDDRWTASGLEGDVYPDEEEVPLTKEKKGAPPPKEPAKPQPPPLKGRLHGKG
ncbi:MAG: hypothetical protein HYR64_00450 [Fimbriimonas ginsengisoli]|uniref:Uncharacterized protein n=1 Tax=Fimbriimonas ginsengisoli TaxID=1005039 RepID=A0A931LYM4_FIMGI|nr:hypothetical protein [Fimbriimonas ginsengisoli]